MMGVRGDMRRYLRGKTGNAVCGIGSLLLTLLTVFAVVSCTALTVHGQDRRPEARQPEDCYRQQEGALVLELREYLNDGGYRNSGVNMTHVVDETGQRSYTIRVHHSLISAMGDEGRAELAEALSGLCFFDENCSFEVQFLCRE